MKRDIPVICEEVEEYGFKITKQELKIIQNLRQDNEKYKDICKKMEIDV